MYISSSLCIRCAAESVCRELFISGMQEVVKTLEEKRKARAAEWYQRKKRILVSYCLLLYDWHNFFFSVYIPSSRNLPWVKTCEFHSIAAFCEECFP